MGKLFIKSRHTGRDCRYPEHREVNLACPPWRLDSGNPCRNDGVLSLAETTCQSGRGTSMRLFHLYFLAISALIFLAGCTPNTRQVKFYLLQPISRSDAQIAKSETPKPLFIGLGPIEIPAYLDRPQIVTGNTGSELRMAEYHRWAEPLKDTITRVLTENLALAMPSSHVLSFPWNRAAIPDYQVEIKIHRFHVDAVGNCELKADWTVLKQNKPVSMKSFQTHVPVSGPDTDYEAKVAAQSQALARFGKEMADELSKLYDLNH